MSMYTWHKLNIPKASELAELQPIEITLYHKQIGLIKKEGNIYAFAATCPHAGARLCEGWTDARGHIVCPLHKYRFDPVNGRNTSGEGYKLFTYPVEVKDDFIYIGLL